MGWLNLTIKIKVRMLLLLEFGGYLTSEPSVLKTVDRSV